VVIEHERSMYLYFNNLKELPNFGCRTTGMALEQLLAEKNSITRYDAMESVNFSGAWDTYARGPLKHGGVVPRRVYEYAWKNRRAIPRVYNVVNKLDGYSGGKHDYIAADPYESVRNFQKFSLTNPRISALADQMDQADGVAINGEGTLIFGNPLRDALYLLFVIAFAKMKGKPVYLLNAMIAPCPYNGENVDIVARALPLLKYCERIAVREPRSYEYLAEKIGSFNVEIIPDALFTWGEKIRSSVRLTRTEPWLCAPHPERADFTHFSFSQPYISISGSSSAWRHEPAIWTQFPKLISALQRKGYPVYCIEACDGDFFLEKMAKECGAFFIPKSSPVMAAAGVIAGSLVYVTGRYHPSIIASASGTPCVFLSSNSHKTLSIQTLLGYENKIEYSICPSNEEIDKISKHVDWLIANRTPLSRSILSNFERCGQHARRYADVLDDTPRVAKT